MSSILKAFIVGPGILFIIVLIIGAAVSRKVSIHNKELYYNRTGTIIKMNTQDVVLPHSSGKVTVYYPVFVGVALIKDDTDPNLYVSLATAYDPTSRHNPLVDMTWFYQHKVGDKVHFKYIKRSRYFSIPKDNQKLWEMKQGGDQ
jgi:hypothetical protein